MNTACPQITLFHSTWFCYIDEALKKLIPCWGHCLCGVCKFSTWVFSRDSSCLPHPKVVHLRWIGVYNVPVSMGVWWALQWKGIWSRVSFYLARSAGIGSSYPRPLRKISRLENNYLTFFYESFFMYSSHLLQYLTLEMFWVFVQKFMMLVMFLWSEICHRNLTRL